MIKEDYVSFETAKLLKEKGFESDDCHTAYDENGEFFLHGDYSKDRYGIVDAPTLQMAMKWLREEYKIFICILFLEEPDMYGFTIEDTLSIKYLATSKNDGYQTYEKACEAAIKYCLQNLI